jgi:hypothetical protein
LLLSIIESGQRTLQSLPVVYRLRFQELQLVHLVTFVQLAVVFDEVLLLLRRSQRSPMRQYPRQAIRTDKPAAWARVQLGPLLFGHSVLYVGYPTCLVPEGVIFKQRIARTAPLIFHTRFLIFPSEGKMKQSEHFLENAENCAHMAEKALDPAAHKHFKRMEAA